MNAKSDDVLAKAKGLREWLASRSYADGAPEVVDGLIEEVERLRAVADACEAEQNPNPTDEYEAVAGWRIGRQADSEAHRESGYCYVARCGFVFRRPVSSEDLPASAAQGDVHREERT